VSVGIARNRYNALAVASDYVQAFGGGVRRHPVKIVWEEVARVLREGATFISQMVGAGTNRELYEYLMGPQVQHSSRSPEVAVADAESVGLRLVDLRDETLEVAFFDIWRCRALPTQSALDRS
jgi:hypothetical protein